MGWLNWLVYSGLDQFIFSEERDVLLEKGLMMMVDSPGGGLIRGDVVSVDISVCRFGSAWFWGRNRWDSDWKFAFDSSLVGSRW
ncbi:hypothetical protein Ancab_004500 [Ancistrocladus abbreviatus]